MQLSSQFSNSIMLRSTLLCSFVLLFVQFSHQQANSTKAAPLVETTLGRIRGSVLTSRNGRDFYAYRGIFYGKAPIGPRRFAAPEPVEPWNGTLDALADGPTCPQAFPNPGVVGAVVRDEDCLSLNVFSANVTASNPVIVFLHGGANICGNPHSENGARPHYLLDKNVVVVSVYFRVGAFGFLSTGTPDAPGNFGYLDQLLALKWVNQHIAKFGGNPNRVTLLGYSSGSLAVTAHLVSPMSAGLFHGVIAVSSSVTSHADIDNVHWSRQLAHELGCPKFGPQNLLNCLRKFNWQQIVDVCARWENYGPINMKWNFEIDGKFLLEHPSEAIRNNRFNRVPIIAGNTRNEFEFDFMRIQDNVDLVNDLNANFGLYTKDIFDFESTGNDDVRAKSLRQFYFNTTDSYQNNLRRFGVMKTDCIIGHNMHRLVEMAKNYTDVYYYRFDYVGGLSAAPGVVHGDDMNYFLPRITHVVGNNSTDNFMVDRMVNLVTSFAANGKPPLIENITWPAITANNSVVLYMDKKPYTSGPFDVVNFALWDKLFPLKNSSDLVE